MRETTPPIIHLSGSPRERGLKYGKEAKEMIEEYIAKGMFYIKLATKQDPDFIVNSIIEKTHYVEAAKNILLI